MQGKAEAAQTAAIDPGVDIGHVHLKVADLPRALSSWIRIGGVAGLLVGAAITLAAAWWLIKWIPEYVMW